MAPLTALPSVLVTAYLFVKNWSSGPLCATTTPRVGPYGGVDVPTVLLPRSLIEYMTYMSRPSGLISIGPLKVLPPWSSTDADEPFAGVVAAPGAAIWS